MTSTGLYVATAFFAVLFIMVGMLSIPAVLIVGGLYAGGRHRAQVEYREKKQLGR